MMRTKKGASILMMIFEILAVLLIIYVLTGMAQAFGDSDSSFKVNTAEEIRMMVNALAAVPGDATVAYPQNLSDYTILLNTGSVTVFKQGDAEFRHVARTFILPQGYDATGVANTVERLCIQKVNRKIVMRKCKDNELQSAI